MYSQPDADTTFSSLGGGLPFFGGFLGIGYRAQTVAGVQVSTEVFSFTDQDIMFAYSRQLGEQLSFGLDYRLLAKGPSRAYPGSDGATANGSSADFSLKYNYQPNFSLGLVWREIGGRFNYQNGAVENFPTNVTVGGAYRWRPDLTYTLDVNKENGQPLLLHSGLEWSPASLISLRFGVDQTAAGASAHSNITSGLGIHLGGFAIDYALYSWKDQSRASIHYFSISYAPPAKKAAVPVTYYPTPEPTPEVKIPRISFPDLPAKHWGKNEIEQLATAGVIWGYPDGTFQPNKKLTRAEFAAIVAAAKHLEPAPVDNANKLITRGEAAKLLDLTEPVSRAKAPLTRAEAALMIYQTPFGQAAIKRLPPLAD